MALLVFAVVVVLIWLVILIAGSPRSRRRTDVRGADDPEIYCSSHTPANEEATAPDAACDD